jgi:hypothetical protein
MRDNYRFSENDWDVFCLCEDGNCRILYELRGKPVKLKFWETRHNNEVEVKLEEGGLERVLGTYRGEKSKQEAAKAFLGFKTDLEMKYGLSPQHH